MSPTQPTPSSPRLDDPEHPEKTQVWIVDKPWLPPSVQMSLGEGPYYEPGTHSVRWVDIFGKKIWWCDLNRRIAGDLEACLRSVSVEDAVGVTADIHGDEENILVAAKYGFAIVHKMTGEMRYLHKVYDGEGKKEKAERMRFNDGAVDSRGRFWAGSMTDNQRYPVKNEGTVYRLDSLSTSTGPALDSTNTSVSAQISPVRIPNGIGWSPTKKGVMYFTDSLTRTIWEYDYDEDSGTVSNKRPWFVLAGSIAIPSKSSSTSPFPSPNSESELYTFPPTSAPDGFQFDINGHLWTAVWGSGMVLRIEDRGEKRVVTGIIRVPARCSSCPRFIPGGGMLITTASEEEPERFGDGGENAGRLFWVDVGVEGAESWKFGCGMASGAEREGVKYITPFFVGDQPIPFGIRTGDICAETDVLVLSSAGPVDVDKESSR